MLSAVSRVTLHHSGLFRLVGGCFIRFICNDYVLRIRYSGCNKDGGNLSQDVMSSSPANIGLNHMTEVLKNDTKTMWQRFKSEISEFAADVRGLSFLVLWRRHILIMCLVFVCGDSAAHPVIDCMPAEIPTELRTIFDDDWTLFWNSETHPRLTQMDSLVYLPTHGFNGIGALTNPNSHYPWAIGGGLHEVNRRDVVIEKFYWDARHRPARYRRVARKNGFGLVIGSDTRPVLRNPPAARTDIGLDCRFPIGAVIGEIITVRWNGITYPIEIRTLTAESDTWGVNVYRRWNRTKDLAESIAEEGYAEIAEHIRQLPSEERECVDELHYVAATSLTFDEAELPQLPNELVGKLLSNRPFFEIGDEGNLYTEATQIQPAKYHPAHVGVGPEQCFKCHQHGGKHAQFFGSYRLRGGLTREWYGYLSGVGKAKDGFAIFSFPHQQTYNGGPIQPNQQLIQSGHLAAFNGEDDYQ